VGEQTPESAREQPRAVRRLLWLLALAALYACLLRGEWVPGGSDDALYLAAARTMVKTGAYLWNALPILHFPPGWTVILSAVLRVSDSFLVLNALASACVIGAAMLWYCILRRYCLPRRAVQAAFVTGILFEWHRFAFTLYSEGLFFLLLAGTVLLALQINEGRRAVWRIPLLLLLCVALVQLRWAAVLAAPIIAGALVSGRLKPALDRRWVCAVLACAVLAGTFLLTHQVLRRSAKLMRDEGRTAAEREGAAAALERDAERVASSAAASPVQYAARAGRSGHWLSMLFWPPTTMGLRSGTFGPLTNAAGFVLLLALAVRALTAARRKHWLWAGCAVYCAALILQHRRPVARLFAPVAPLILLGVWEGLLALGGRKAGARRWLARSAVAAFLVAVLACNGALLAVNAFALRSPRFATMWLAGEYGEILAVAYHLNDEGVGDGEVAATRLYADPYRGRNSPWAWRTLYLLTEKDVRSLPDELDSATPDERLLAWARSHGVRFVIARSPEMVRRIWHIRRGSHRQEPPAGGDAGRASFYELYEVREDGFERVPLEPPRHGPRRMPGL